MSCWDEHFDEEEKLWFISSVACKEITGKLNKLSNSYANNVCSDDDYNTNADKNDNDNDNLEEETAVCVAQ